MISKLFGEPELSDIVAPLEGIYTKIVAFVNKKYAEAAKYEEEALIAQGKAAAATFKREEAEAMGKRFADLLGLSDPIASTPSP